MCLLVAAYVLHEFSFETCHSKSDRIHRVSMDYHPTDEFFVGDLANAAAPFGPALAEVCPAVEAIARFHRPHTGVKLQFEDQVSGETSVYIVEPDFLNVFDVAVLQGNPSVDLAVPGTIFLTETLAHRLFGDADPVGRLLRADNTYDVRVAGVLAEFPSNTKINCEALMSYATLETAGFDLSAWNDFWSDYLFVLLRPGADPKQVEGMFAGVVSSHLAVEEAAAYTYKMQTLRDIHLSPASSNELQPQGDMTLILLFGSIALISLVIACINFINLTTARAAHRVKDLSIRKITGASRGQLISQLLTESLLVTMAAAALALVAFEACHPMLNHFVNRRFDVSLVEQPSTLLVALMLIVLVSLATGLYPALYLSRFRPLRFLKTGGKFGSTRSYTRRALVVFQFGVAIVLIAVSTVVFNQMQYSYTWDKGFDSDNLVTMLVERQNRERMEPLKTALQQAPGVSGVTAVDWLPGLPLVSINKYSLSGHTDAEPAQLRTFRTDADGASVLGLRLAAGRLLDYRDAAEGQRNVVVDQQAVAALGLDEPLGATLEMDEARYTIVGVLDGFHGTPTHRSEWPAVFHFDEKGLRYVVARIAPGSSRQTLPRIEAVWKSQIPEQHFEPQFLDDVIRAHYADFERLGTLLWLFSAIAIMIAGLGIGGLASYAAERRRKEIGVRRVVGASVLSIVRLLGREFIALVAVSAVLAGPLAWYLADRWLQQFVHRVAINPVWIVLAGLGALTIAVASSAWQAVRAARANPVETLRYE